MLTEFPNDIIWLILCQCGVKELYRLSQTCTEIRDTVSEIFVGTCLRDRMARRIQKRVRTKQFADKNLVTTNSTIKSIYDNLIDGRVIHFHTPCIIQAEMLSKWSKIRDMYFLFHLTMFEYDDRYPSVTIDACKYYKTDIIDTNGVMDIFRTRDIVSKILISKEYTGDINILADGHVIATTIEQNGIKPSIVIGPDIDYVHALKGYNRVYIDNNPVEFIMVKIPYINPKIVLITDSNVENTHIEKDTIMLECVQFRGNINQGLANVMHDPNIRHRDLYGKQISYLYDRGSLTVSKMQLMSRL